MILHIHDGTLWLGCSQWGLFDTGEPAPAQGPVPSPGFDRVECLDCQFDAVIPAERRTPYCPLCMSDCGHDVPMSIRRPALSTDRPEGRDWRVQP